MHLRNRVYSHDYIAEIKNSSCLKKAITNFVYIGKEQYKVKSLGNVAWDSFKNIYNEHLLLFYLLLHFYIAS